MSYDTGHDQHGLPNGHEADLLGKNEYAPPSHAALQERCCSLWPHPLTTQCWNPVLAHAHYDKATGELTITRTSPAATSNRAQSAETILVRIADTLGVAPSGVEDEIDRLRRDAKLSYC